LLKFLVERTLILAAISHDLRLSLTRLELAAEAHASAAIGEEIAHMRSMVESTLALATDAVASRQAIDLAALLISIADDCADAGNDCCYEGPDHCVIVGHLVSLRRALWNVVDNALKYGDAAQLTLSCAVPAVCLTITDNGPGIRPDLVEEAFAPFRRLDSARSGNIPGSGLGLTIARDVIHGHGGMIAIRPAHPHGTCVEITLPAA
jgi:signal transduction histidine kinase